MCNIASSSTSLRSISFQRLFSGVRGIVFSSSPKEMASNSNGTSSCKLVLANSIAKKLLDEVKIGLQTLDRPPQLHGFLANEDPAARMYADWTAKTCKEKYVLSDRFSPSRGLIKIVVSTLHFENWIARTSRTRYETLIWTKTLTA